MTRNDKGGDMDKDKDKDELNSYKQTIDKQKLTYN